MLFAEDKRFNGDKKIEHYSLLSRPEKKIIDWCVPKIPNCIKSYHLTLSALLWNLLIVLFGFLTKYNIYWLWGVTVMIVIHWLADSLDGSLGRYRQAGLVRWGYYMDHFLDYIFICSILIAYSFIFNDRFNSLFFILAIFGAFLVNSYLSFAVTNEFRINYSKIGPTEIQLLFVIINTLVIFFHKTYLSAFLPYVLVISLLGLVAVVYQTQKIIWHKDKKENLDGQK